MIYSKAEVEQVSKEYELSETTVSFLLELYGMELLQKYISELKEEQGDKVLTEEQVIYYCASIQERDAAKVTEKVDISFIEDNRKDDSNVVLINNVIDCLFWVLVGGLSGFIVSALFDINMSYILAFLFFFTIIYKVLVMFLK